jgi:DNA-binding transcriptional LysR family regulator
METRVLKMFCEVARCGSLVAASGKLHLTASAVSHALKGLETDVGCRLFDRVGRKLVLNHAGEHLLAQIEPPLAALDAASASVRQFKEWGRTRLRVGVAASACQYLLPGVVRELKKAHPNLTLQVESGNMPEMVEHIRDNRVDLALGVAPDSTAGLEVRTVFRDELLFVFAPSHPWAEGKPISREELRRQPLILYQRNSLTAQLVDGYFRSLDIAPSALMEIASIEAIKELVRLGLGVSVLAPWAADKELARGKLRMRPLGAQALRREWVIACRAGRRLSLAEEAFVRLCRTAAAGLRKDRKDVPASDR